MTADIEAVVLVEDGARESTYLRVAFEHAGSIALAREQIAGSESGGSGATDDSAVACYKAPHLSRGVRRVHGPNLPFKSSCIKGYRFSRHHQCTGHHRRRRGRDYDRLSRYLYTLGGCPSAQNTMPKWHRKGTSARWPELGVT